MRHFVRTTLFAASFGLACVLSQTARADDIVIEKQINNPPSGVVIIENPASRTFKLEGHTHVYTAPPDVDISTLNGKEVTLSVNPDGSVTKVERKTTTYK